MEIKALHVFAAVLLVAGVGGAAAWKLRSAATPAAVAFDANASFREAAGRFEAELRKQMPENPAAQFSFKFYQPTDVGTYQATDRLDQPDQLAGSYKQSIWMTTKLNAQDSEALLGIKELTLTYDATFRFRRSGEKWVLTEAFMMRNTIGLPTTDPAILRQYEKVGDMRTDTNGDVGGRVKRAQAAAGL